MKSPSRTTVAEPVVCFPLDPDAAHVSASRPSATLPDYGLALVVAAAFAVPVLSSNMSHASALERLVMSEAALDAAYDDRSDAYTQLFTVTDRAVVVYDESGEFAKVVRAALLADSKSLSELTEARIGLAELASLTSAEDGTTVAPEITVPLAEKDSSTPTTPEAIKQQAADNDKLTAKVTGEAEDVREKVSDITEQGASIGELTEAVVASGAAYAGAGRRAL